MLRIGQVAKESGVGVETVRFYESEGLIALPKRSASGYRQYSASIIEQIKFIKHAKKLGFSLKEVSELIKLKSAPNARCDRVKATASAKITDIQEKIDALEQMKTALQPLVDQCKSSDPIGDCSILNAPDENPAT
jgi:MerR family mercuric resistance operon transcriptional regulator